MDRQRESGLSVSRVLSTENSFYRWRRCLTVEMEARFVPLSIAERETVDIELPCGATVKVATDRQSLQEVFAALLSVEAHDA